jgi:hypothetical protein
MKKFLCGMVAVCAIIVSVCVIYQVNAKESTYMVRVSELDGFHVWSFRGYAEAVYNGASYTSSTKMFPWGKTASKLTLREKGFVKQIVAVNFE